MGLLRWKDGELTVNFGKKKGESLKRLLINEPNFLRWMLKGDFDTEVRMIIADLLDNGRLPPAPESSSLAESLPHRQGKTTKGE
jgi:hypothetical protein